MVRHFPVRLQLKVLHKVLRAAALRSVRWIRNFRWSILGLLSAGNLGKSVKACLTVENCERLAVLASGVQVVYFTILNSTLCSSSCTHTLYFLSQI